MRTGISFAEETKAAVHEASATALSNLKNPSLVLVFNTEDHLPERVLSTLSDVTGNVPLIGGCVAGVFLDYKISTTGVLVIAVRADGEDLAIASEKGLKGNPYDCGVSLGNRLIEHIKDYDTYKTIIVIPDGITTSVGGFVDGLFSIVGSTIQCAGGASGDNLRFIKTYQYYNSEILEDSAVAVPIETPDPLGTYICSGWHAYGLPLFVNSSIDNIIHEMNYKSAIDAYMEACSAPDEIRLARDSFARFAMEHPIGVPIVLEEDKFLIRDPISFKESSTFPPLYAC